MLEAVSKAQGAFVWRTSHPIGSPTSADLCCSVEAKEGRQVSRICPRWRASRVLRNVPGGHGQGRIGQHL